MEEDKNPETVPGKEKGFGSLLKSEREKKGLSISQVAGITKLRKHFIEALENEEWEKLPARVFTKGFIRSYTMVLGLDLNEVMGLFENSAPQKKEEDFSKALIHAEKKKNKTIYLLIPLIVIAAIIVYFLMEWEWNKAEVSEPESASVYMKSISETPEAEGIEASPASSGVEDKAGEVNDAKPEIIEVESENLPSEEEGKDDTQAEEEIINLEEEAKTGESVERTPYTDEPAAVEDIQQDTGIEESEYFLRAKVNMLTYLKIYTDDSPPVEYMFKPGRTPDWRADEGFFIVIGNAAGIEFDFNGTAIKDLGEEGQVRTLRLPDDFKSEWEEESGKYF